MNSSEGWFHCNAVKSRSRSRSDSNKNAHVSGVITSIELESEESGNFYFSDSAYNSFDCPHPGKTRLPESEAETKEKPFEHGDWFVFPLLLLTPTI